MKIIAFNFVAFFVVWFSIGWIAGAYTYGHFQGEYPNIAHSFYRTHSGMLAPGFMMGGFGVPWIISNYKGHSPIWFPNRRDALEREQLWEFGYVSSCPC